MTDEAQNLGTALPFCRHIWRPTAFGAWNAQSQLVATEWRCFKCGQPWTQTNTPLMSLSQILGREPIPFPVSWTPENGYSFIYI